MGVNILVRMQNRCVGIVDKKAAASYVSCGGDRRWSYKETREERRVGLELGMTADGEVDENNLNLQLERQVILIKKVRLFGCFAL